MASSVPSRKRVSLGIHNKISDNTRRTIRIYIPLSLFSLFISWPPIQAPRLGRSRTQASSRLVSNPPCRSLCLGWASRSRWSRATLLELLLQHLSDLPGASAKLFVAIFLGNLFKNLLPLRGKFHEPHYFRCHNAHGNEC